MQELDKHESCHTSDFFVWVNSRGEKFHVYAKHLQVCQMIADDYEQTGEKPYRVLKRDDSGK